MSMPTTGQPSTTEMCVRNVGFATTWLRDKTITADELERLEHAAAAFLRAARKAANDA